MNNFELIDDYLTGKLNEDDKKSFEQQLAADPALKADVELQKEIIQGLKAARASELKAMLNKVVVTSPTLYFSPLRIAAGLIGTAVLAIGLYFYLDKKRHFIPAQMSSSLVDSIRQTEQNDTQLNVDSISSKKEVPAPVKSDKPSKTNAVTPAVSPDQNENKPAIDLLDPMDELSENEINNVPPEDGKSTISIAKIDVAIINSERKYKLHYQFSNHKLILYGNFNKGLYEIIEVNGKSSRSLFLNYKTSYYQLDETRQEITMLKEIRDTVLIQKLKAFQSN